MVKESEGVKDIFYIGLINKKKAKIHTFTKYILLLRGKYPSFLHFDSGRHRSIINTLCDCVKIKSQAVKVSKLNLHLRSFNLHDIDFISCFTRGSGASMIQENPKNSWWPELPKEKQPNGGTGESKATKIEDTYINKKQREATDSNRSQGLCRLKKTFRNLEPDNQSKEESNYSEDVAYV